MIIGLPLNEKALTEDSTVSRLLPEAHALFIYNTSSQTGSSVLVDDLLATHKTVSILEALIIEKVQALICQEIFALGYKAARENGIEVFKAETPLLEKNLSLFKNGLLKPFSFDSAKNNGCSAGCSGCDDRNCKAV